MPLSILDFAMAGKGVSACEALVDSIELARRVGRRDFTRYWLVGLGLLAGLGVCCSVA